LNEKFYCDFDDPGARILFRECWHLNLLSEDEFMDIIKLIADRNLIPYSYDEETAEKLKERLTGHYELMKKIFDRLEMAN
jgi:hypothetical protein